MMKKKFTRWLSVSALLILVPVPAYVYGEMILQPFPFAEIVEQSSQDIPEYRFVTGKVSSIGALVRTEEEQIISGKLIKKTYEIPRVHTTREVMQYYQAQLQRLNANKLFYCEARNCGRSNDWANGIFGERILFGPDRFQYYLASTFVSDGRQYASVVYTIRRGNQRVYAHVEQIELAEKLDTTKSPAGILVVSEEEIGLSGALKDRIQDWLSRQQAGEDPVITLVVYSRRSDKSAAENSAHASSLGRALKAYLNREFVSDEALQVIVVGPYASPEQFSQDDSFVEMFVE